MTTERLILLVFWIALGFLLGALPFSVWVGRFAMRTDITAYGDHNPGATNVFRAGSKRWGAIALLLDSFKGAVPVGLAHYAFGFDGWPLVLIALAPVVGHAYSPFLGWRGGKAVAVTFGIWCGLTVWEGPTVMGILLGLGTALIAANGWAVMLMMAGWLAYFLVTPAGFNLLNARAELVPVMLVVWLANTLILAWKHRSDLSHRPALRLPGRRQGSSGNDGRQK